MAYDLSPLAAPRSAGAALRALVALAEAPGTGAALARKFLADIGVAAMRALPANDPPWSVHPVLRGAGAPAADPNAVLARAAALPVTTGGPLETAADFAAAYREGRLTPRDVAHRIVEWTHASNGAALPLRAVIAQHEGDLLAQAEAATARFDRGAPLGPLDGVPVAVKDELDQQGYPTTVGTRFLGGAPAAEDAEVVARLRAAGVLLLGKANMHEIGIGVTGVNPHFGPARNPYDPTRVTGGSSSGPAAAVAAGLCPIAIGADGGGSIRIPSALCGVVGLKPTFGRASEVGAAPLCWSLAHVGPIGATVRDVALAYALMAGSDPKDPNTAHQPPVTLEDVHAPTLAGVRLGVYRPWFEDAAPDVVARADALLEGLVRCGAEVRPIDLPELGLLRTVHLVTIVSEMLASQLPYAAAHRRDYGADTRLNLALARHLTSRDYVHAQRLRTRLAAHFDRALAEVDAIVTPTTGVTAPPIAADSLATGDSNLAVADRIMRFAPAANLTGLPAVTVPAGYDRDGLPVGFQAMGRAWSEALLLRIARAAEGLVERRPPVVHRRLL